MQDSKWDDKMESQEESIPLHKLLAGYKGKPFSELPEDLQVKVQHFYGFNLGFTKLELWRRKNVSPKKASMTLCQLNPFTREHCEDPQRFNADYPALLDLFEAVAIRKLAPSDLSE